MRFRVFPIALAAAAVFSSQAAGDPPSLTGTPIVLTSGWSVYSFALNDSGTVVFAGGGWGGADGLVKVRPNSFLKFASRGDPVPGVPGSLFTGFASGRFGNFSLNNRDEVAFAAFYAACGDPAEIDACSRTHQQYSGLFHYSDGVIRAIALDGEPVPGSEGQIFHFFEQVRLNNTGMILFRGQFGSAERPGVEMLKSALFLWSDGRFSRVSPEDVIVSTEGQGLIAFTDEG
ncbi:MAG: hypothetical protein DMG07_20710, partial [Acidobacteria bacterium]